MLTEVLDNDPEEGIKLIADSNFLDVILKDDDIDDKTKDFYQQFFISIESGEIQNEFNKYYECN